MRHLLHSPSSHAKRRSKKQYQKRTAEACISSDSEDPLMTNENTRKESRQSRCRSRNEVKVKGSVESRSFRMGVTIFCTGPQLNRIEAERRSAASAEKSRVRETIRREIGVWRGYHNCHLRCILESYWLAFTCGGWSWSWKTASRKICMAESTISILFTHYVVSVCEYVQRGTEIEAGDPLL